MLLTLICALSMILSISWLLLALKYEWETDIGAAIVTTLTVVWFLINTFCVITGPVNTRANIKEFQSAKLTIQQQRENKLSEYERATLTKEIVDKNQWLAKEQFWAKSLWLNWYYDPEILYITPIK